jgi:hypothetical protein
MRGGRLTATRPVSCPLLGKGHATATVVRRITRWLCNRRLLGRLRLDETCVSSAPAQRSCGRALPNPLTRQGPRQLAAPPAFGGSLLTGSTDGSRSSHVLRSLSGDPPRLGSPLRSPTPPLGASVPRTVPSQYSTLLQRPLSRGLARSGGRTRKPTRRSARGAKARTYRMSRLSASRPYPERAARNGLRNFGPLGHVRHPPSVRGRTHQPRHAARAARAAPRRAPAQTKNKKKSFSPRYHPPSAAFRACF